MTKFAYVTVLYGNNIYLAGALALGYSLAKMNSPFDRVVLVTPDVSDEYRGYLKKIYTWVIGIDYIPANPDIFLEEQTRFRDVFTKLACLGLVQYKKIILLDLDMVVVQNIDHLFKLDPPGAVLKRYHYPYGKKIPKRIMCPGGKLVNGINAGLMLLEPNRDELESIRRDLQKNGRIAKYKYPEQEYLGLRYCGKWTSITFGYNFQFGLTGRVKKYNYTADNIYVVHYSSSYKPWNYLVADREPAEDELQYRKNHMNFYKLWDSIYAKVRKEFADDGVVLPY